MEEHRLKPMVEDYNPEIFNQLYKELTPLKRKLASQIDYRRFGLTYEDMLSWFDVKFIFTFNKYYHRHNTNVLRGHLISALSFYKNRILRQAYKPQFSQTIIDMSDLENAENLFKDPAPESDNFELFKNILFAFMQKNLTTDAYNIFQLDLNPPEHLLTTATGTYKKIPAEVMANYLNLPTDSTGIRYVTKLRKIIQQTQAEAKELLKEFMEQRELVY